VLAGIGSGWRPRVSGAKTECVERGGSSYTLRTPQAQTAGCGVSTITYSSQNLGSGSQFVFIGIDDGAANLSGAGASVTVNGTALGSAPIVSFSGNDLYAWGGTVTTTGSDTIVLTATAGNTWCGQEVDIFPYTMTGLVSTTAKATNSNAASSITASPCAVGDFVFAMVARGATFAASAQTPTHAQTVGVNGAYIADWIANSTGCSGGTFTATNGGFNGELIANWH
jgi:hypothetical protein